MSARRRLQMAIVGTGSFGAEFTRYIQEVAEPVAVCDAQATALAQFASTTQLSLAPFTDFATLLSTVEVDAVAILTPHHTHRDLTVQAARAGKHVYCEKAMANTVVECWDMVRACDAAGVKLMVGHKRRLRPPWARMIELRDDLGPVRSISACAYSDGRPYDYQGWWTRRDESGGTLSVNGVHHIDWMRAMAGDVAIVRAVRPPQTDQRFDFPDTLHVSLTFHTGAVGTLDVSFVYPVLRYRETGGPLVICADGGMRLVPYIDHIDLYWQRRDQTENRLERFNDLGFDHAFRQEFSDFVRWITTGEAPCLTWREGLRCVEVIEAARRSADEGGTILSLPLYPQWESVDTAAPHASTV